MRPRPGEWDDLRLAAKAADRGNAGKELWPAFEKRLKELGYGPRAIAHAFSTLTGPGTVTEALATLAHYQRSERVKPVPVEFEIVEHDPGLPVGYLLTITGVERDDHRIQIRYTIRPPLAPQAGPRSEARDDRDHEYSDLGGAVGLTEPRDCSTGVLAMPLPQQRFAAARPDELVETPRIPLGERCIRIAAHALERVTRRSLAGWTCQQRRTPTAEGTRHPEPQITSE